MKQLLIIGILVAVLLLVLMGLSKLGKGGDDAGPVDDAVSDTPTNLPPVSQETPEATTTLPTDTPDTMTTDQTSQQPVENTVVVMKTNKGDITIELLTKEMPVTAGNFLKLATDDYYDGVKFHRVIDGFMIQGGDPLTKDDAQQARWGTGGPGYTIPDEFGPRYSNARGTLSMANAGPNTGGSQFFINTVDNVFLDGKHPVFGRVIAGMDIVDAISKSQKNARDVPLSPVVINDIAVQE